MSWIERVKEGMVITLGDGKTYHPQYVNATKVKEFNYAEFDFGGTAGTYVPRKTSRGRKFSLDIIFQGADNLDVAAAFDVSSENRNPWQLSHPLYGSLLVQPTAIQFDNVELNVSRINVQVIETITLDKANDVVLAPASVIHSSATAIYQSNETNLATTVPVVSSSQKRQLLQQLTDGYSRVAQQVSNAADANNYLNTFNDATSILNTIGSNTATIGASVQRFTAMPYAFVDTIENRINIFKTQFELLKSAAGTLFQRNSKKLVAFQMSALLTAAAQASITSVVYNNVDEVARVLHELMTMQEDYTTTIDGMSSNSVNNADSYVADYDTVGSIYSLFSYVREHLATISLQSRLRYVYVLPHDMTLFEVVANTYGYDEQDANLNRIIQENNLCANELLLLQAGRHITYYK